LGKFIPKITTFGDFGGVSPRFLATTVKFGAKVRTWDSLPQAKLFKNRLRGYTFWAHLYSKNYQFRQFWGRKPTFKKVTMVKFGTRVRALEFLPMPNFVEIAKEIYRFVANLYQKLPIWHL